MSKKNKKEIKDENIDDETFSNQSIYDFPTGSNYIENILSKVQINRNLEYLRNTSSNPSCKPSKNLSFDTLNDLEKKFGEKTPPESKRINVKPNELTRNSSFKSEDNEKEIRNMQPKTFNSRNIDKKDWLRTKLLDYENSNMTIHSFNNTDNKVSKNIVKNLKNTKKVKDNQEMNPNFNDISKNSIQNTNSNTEKNKLEERNSELNNKDNITDENSEIRNKYMVKSNVIIPKLTDKYGFVISENQLDKKIESDKSSNQTEKLAEKWHKLISDIKMKNLKLYETNSSSFYYNYIFENDKAEKLVFKGIPLFLKYKLWKLFVDDKKRFINSKIVYKDFNSNLIEDCNENDDFNETLTSIYKNKERKNQSSDKQTKPPTFTLKRFKNILNKNTQIKEEKNVINTNICSYEHQIHVDVQRTFRRHSLFQEDFGPGQIRLFNVLVSFANIHPEIGYCQGMSSFVALILMYLPQDETLELVLNIFQINKNLFFIFDKELSGISKIIEVQTMMLKKILPLLYIHLIQHQIELGSFVFSWYLTLFTRFDIGLVLRIWDLFLFYDFSVLVFVGVALMKCMYEEIMEMEGEELLYFMGNIESYKFDEDRVVKYVKQFMRDTDMEDLRDDLGIGW